MNDGGDHDVHPVERIGQRVGGFDTGGQVDVRQVPPIDAFASEDGGKLGVSRPQAGTVADPRDMHRHGVAHIPEDRQREGIVKDFDITENLALTAYYIIKPIRSTVLQTLIGVDLRLSQAALEAGNCFHVDTAAMRLGGRL